MGRSRRSARQHGWFHVTNRGVDREDVFGDDRAKEMFEEEIAHATERFPVEVHAYCLMSSHFHLVLHCPDGHLSDFMQTVLQRFAIRHNRRTEREGYVFTSRFRSDPILGEGDELSVALRMVCRYVHRNPLDAVALSELRSFGRSSYQVFSGRRKAPGWLTTEVLEAEHGDDRHRLVTFTETALPSDLTAAFGAGVRTCSTDDVIWAVAHVSRVAPGDLLDANGRDRNGVRSLAAHLCVSMRTDGTDDLAQVFGVASRRVFANLARRGKRRAVVDTRMAAMRRNAVELIWTGRPLHQVDDAA